MMSTASGNVDDIAQSIVSLNERIAAAMKRKDDAVTNYHVVAKESKRIQAGKFYRTEITQEAFAAEIQRIDDIATRQKYIAQAAEENLGFLHKLVAGYVSLQNSIIHEDFQTKRMIELAAEYKKSVESREAAIENNAAARQAIADSEKLIKAKSQVPTLALFDSLCISLGMQHSCIDGALTSAAMLKEPVVIAPIVIALAAIAPAAIAPAAIAPVAKPVITYCSNSKCSNVATLPSGSGVFYCSVKCVASVHAW